LYHAYTHQDRRDAELMFQAQRMRRVYCRPNGLVAGFDDTDRIDIGGCVLELWCSYTHLNPT
jgi:hypothetical protein